MNTEQTVKTNALITYTCKTCGRLFTAKRSRKNVKYCCHKCARGWTISPIAKQHRSEGLKRAYAEGRKSNKREKNPRWGRHCSEETKRKISEGNKGKTGLPGALNPMWKKKLTPEAYALRSEKMKGRHYHSEEHKQKLRDKFKIYNPMQSLEARQKRSEKYKKLFIGNKNPNWKGGASFEPYCVKFNKEFKERVRLFFDNKCGICKNEPKKRKLSVHHVNYDKMTCCNDTKPLFIPLCGSCHTKTNGNRTNWEEKFTQIINNEYGGKCYFSKEEMKLKQQQIL